MRIVCPSCEAKYNLDDSVSLLQVRVLNTPSVSIPLSLNRDWRATAPSAPKPPSPQRRLLLRHHVKNQLQRQCLYPGKCLAIQLPGLVRLKTR